MSRLGDLPKAELNSRLKLDGVGISIPPFTFLIRSDIPVVADGLRLLYGDYRVVDGADQFMDFHVEVKTRWKGLKRVAQFSVDGFEPFTPLAFDEGFALLEWGMNWCVTGYGHNWLSLHSAVLENKGRAVLLPAPPGSGKSTLCAALMLGGWRLLSDEMALLDPVSGRITPSPRPVSLKNQSIELVRHLDTNAVIGPEAYDKIKGRVAHLKVSEKSLANAESPVSPAWVVFPRYVPELPVTLSRRSKSSSLLELASNSFNYHVHGRQGFEAMTHLVDRCDCFDLSYGHIREALEWFDALEPVA